MRVITRLMNHHHDAIAQTGDDDLKARELHFRKMRAFQEIVAELKSAQTIAHEIEINLQDEEATARAAPGPEQEND